MSASSWSCRSARGWQRPCSAAWSWRTGSKQLHPLALALACGINYGVAAFLVKLVISDVSHGLPALLTDWPIYALAVVGPAGFILNEDAYQQGTLIAPVLAIITACDPIISIALGALWLNERLNASPVGIAGEISRSS